MEQEQIKRDYTITDSELTVFSQQLCGYITRDISEFTIYGVTAANVTALKALGDAFEYFPLDSVYKQNVTLAVEAKDVLREDVQKIVRSMALRVELKWGKNSAQYRSLEIADLSKLGDDAYITRARGVYTHMNTRKADYTAEGLTPEMLTAMDTKIKALDQAIYDANEKLTERKLKSIERIQKGNEIYRLVSRYCEIGKRIWDGVNSVKFENYVIYAASAGPLKPPTGLKYLIEQNTAVWDAVENATSYELEYSADGEKWSEAYGGADNMVHYFPPQEGCAYFRCRARNANGYGEFSEVLKTGYYQILPPPSNIGAKIEANTDNGLMMVWDEVPSATNYLIYASIVPIGKPEENYELFDKTESTKYKRELERGVRYYFQLVAENSAQTSLHSKAVYVDVNAPLPS